MFFFAKLLGAHDISEDGHIQVHHAGGLLRWKLDNSDSSQHSLRQEDSHRLPLCEHDTNPSKNAYLNAVLRLVFGPAGARGLNDMAAAPAVGANADGAEGVPPSMD